MAGHRKAEQARLAATDQMFHRLQKMLPDFPDAEDSDRIISATVYYLVDGTHLTLTDAGHAKWEAYDMDTLAPKELGEWHLDPQENLL